MSKAESGELPPSSVDPPGSEVAPAPQLARQAIVVTLGVYLGYLLLSLLPLPGDLRYLLLVGAFYFLPGWLLRREPARQARYQVGPDRVVPPWSWRGARVAAVSALLVFPPFVLLFFWFYSRVCAGDLSMLAPVTWVEGIVPGVGGLEDYLHRLCRPHEGGMWPQALRWPADWLEHGGLGFVLAVAVEVFAVALPEEVFHRGYLMSALEERWPPRRRVLGVPLGLGAVLASLVFAVGHLVGMAEVARLATFFPALVFSWLWRRSGSLWAPALFHAAANLLMAVLIASTFPT
ncbi:MAG: CPBP family intramembrane metalloprotease [Myxococcales bacterium]|nr:CPBP family intramembrane metalloprotease [Myxococcales bacterium]